MNETLECVCKLKSLFDKGSINNQNELILVPSTNLYILLKDIENKEQLNCKVIEWLSRDACKTEPYYKSWRNLKYQAMVRDNINTFLGTDFDGNDWYYIYTYLGNAIKHSLCLEFVRHNFDLNWLKAEINKLEVKKS